VILTLAAALFELHVSRWQPLVSVGRLVSDGYGSEREDRAGGAHIDTDFAGDTDDACAVATTLGWPEVEVVGITTTADPDGPRARYLGRFLELAGRPDVPVAAGAGRSLTTGGRCAACLPHERYGHRRLGIDS
jgi:hypothetical protein